jgi:hypothetical protein
MSRYRLLLASPDRPGFLDSATIDQAPGATLIGWEYAGSCAIELWREPWRGARLAAANDAGLRRAGRGSG